jgi:zinc protease
MKHTLAFLLLFSLIVFPCLAQETPAKPEAKAPEAKAPEAKPAEALPSLDQILDKYIESLGGKAALEKLTTRQISGSFEIPAMNASGTLKGFAKAPNKSLMIIDVPGYGVIQQGYDGTVAWGQDPMAGLREITGTELATTKRDVDFNQALHLKELFAKLTVKSKEKVGEKDAFVVEATPAEGKIEKLYFDATTGLLIRQDAERESPQGASSVEMYFEDYKEIDGIKVPFTMRRVMPAFAMTVKIDEIKHNVEIDNAKFTKPAAQP